MAKKYLRLACPNCKKKLKTDQPAQAGVTANCPFCGCTIALPYQGENAQAQPAVHAAAVDTAHNMAQPAKNPLVYALGGALLVLLLGGGMMGAFMLGKGKAPSLAQAPQQPAEPMENNSNPPAPSQPKPNIPSGTNARPDANRPSSSNSGNTSDDDDWDFEPDDEPSRPSRPLSPTNPAQPEDDSDDNPTVDDSNRPRKNALELIQPVGAQAAASLSGAAAPIVVEVPVYVPFFIPTNSSKSNKPPVKPDLNVVIRPQDLSQAVLKVDHLSQPGIGTKLVVTLDQTPKTPVEIKVTADKGLVVDQAKLTFAANVKPIQQVIAISGDGKAKMQRGPSKMFYVTLTASGGGLKANKPARIPVQVLRRNSFKMTSGVSLIRADAVKPPISNPVLSNWRFSVSGVVPPRLLGEQYTPDYVQLTWGTGPTARIRIYEDHIELESPIGSGTYRSQATGSWQ